MAQRQSAATPEPRQFRHGKEHDKAQKVLWAQDLAKEDARLEGTHVQSKESTGTRGFVDVRATLDAKGKDGLFVEVKTDNLDNIATPSQLETLIQHHITQINDYRFSPSFSYDTTQSVVQFEHRPQASDLAEYIEDRFNDEGIMCVFLDD